MSVYRPYMVDIPFSGQLAEDKFLELSQLNTHLASDIAESFIIYGTSTASMA